MGYKLNKRKERKERKIFLFLGVLLVLLVVMAGCGTSDVTPNTIIDAEDFNELAVINGTTPEEVVEELNSKRNRITVTLDNGRTVTADVSWEEEEDQVYSKEGPGPYTFKGTAKYQDLMKEVYIDVKVLAYFEILNLSIEPEEITEETELVILSLEIKNISEFGCIQEIDITIESVTGDFKYDGEIIDIIEVELEGGEEKPIDEEMEVLTFEGLTDMLESLGLTLEDINREWHVIASTNNDTEKTNVTVNIQK